VLGISCFYFPHWYTFIWGQRFEKGALPRLSQLCSTWFLLHAKTLKTEDVMRYIFPPEDRAKGRKNFHATWTLDGHITQLVRDCSRLLVGHTPDISSHSTRAKTPFKRTLFILGISAMQIWPTSESTCASTPYPASGIRPFGFLCFQNTKNPLKIQKTFETCNLETQVYFPEN